MTKRVTKLQEKHASPASDSDDEAPEEVSKTSAKEKALELIRHEEEARATAAAAAKRYAQDGCSKKRKTRSSTKAKEEEEQEDELAEDGEVESAEVDELPDDILSAVAARNEEEEEERERQERSDARVRARSELAKKRQHIRTFGNIEVKTLRSIEATTGRELSKEAEDFMALRTAPHRARMNVLAGHPSQFSKKQKTRRS
ncbi:TPA: hypothetical protein N0F65_007794 [Lagenidium giganteum]|uniref:Uncharacterized protein n=1 Tax=Lagenidium giganteum TaxID=4803 RepID=A0AAV2Z3M0_9STRA|nr:TPA: hypothetical protein N0F65_007794 [Lagenidium giganteum]